MPSELPIVFLAFANQADDHLAMLKDESRDIFNALQPLEREGQIAIHREESSEFDELYQDLLAYDDRIVIFHYGGHADGASLELEDGTGGAGGIAGLLGQQSSLKLVFLNGCATRDQVRLLHAARVPAVIATSVKINDNKATQFSTAFYSALVEGRSIFEAFESARSFIEGKFGSSGSSGAAISRQTKHQIDEETTQPGGLEWALYTQKHATSDLEQWRLPEAREAWLVQLEDTRGPLRGLDGNPLLIEHRSRSRTVDAIHCQQCGTISSATSEAGVACPVCGSGKVRLGPAHTAVANQVLPFTVTEEEARAQVMTHIGARISRGVRLNRLFVPHWVFDVDTRTTLEAERGVIHDFKAVPPKLEWEPVKEELALSDSYLVSAGSAPVLGDGHWNLDQAEALDHIDPAVACVPLERSVQLAFDQVASNLEQELEAEIADRVGGHQQRNVTTDTRYRKVNAHTVLLPHWYATAKLEQGQAGFLINGQTGALRTLPSPGNPNHKDGIAVKMTNRTYASNMQRQVTSLAASVFAGAGIGLMVGLMLGLAAPPGDGKSTVAIFIGAVGAALAVLLGLNDRHFSTAKALRIGAFGLFALAGVATGLYAREHSIFTPSLVQQKNELLDAGFSECEAQDQLSGLSLRVLPPKNEANLAERKKAFIDAGFSNCQVLHLLAGWPDAAGTPLNGDGGAQKMSAVDRALSSTGLMSNKVEFAACSKLSGLPYPPEHSWKIVREQFQSHGDKWAAYASSVNDTGMSEEEKLEQIFAARFAVCFKRVQITSVQCEKLNAIATNSEAEDIEILAAFGEVEDLKPVRDRITKKIDSTSEQKQALDLLVTNVLCKSE